MSILSRVFRIIIFNKKVASSLMCISLCLATTSSWAMMTRIVSKKKNIGINRISKKASKPKKNLNVEKRTWIDYKDLFSDTEKFNYFAKNYPELDLEEQQNFLSCVKSNSLNDLRTIVNQSEEHAILTLYLLLKATCRISKESEYEIVIVQKVLHEVLGAELFAAYGHLIKKIKQLASNPEDIIMTGTFQEFAASLSHNQIMLASSNYWANFFFQHSIKLLKTIGLAMVSVVVLFVATVVGLFLMGCGFFFMIPIAMFVFCSPIVFWDWLFEDGDLLRRIGDDFSRDWSNLKNKFA